MAERSSHQKERQFPSISFSTTQHAHLFPKNRRFVHQNPECSEAYYDQKSLLSTKGTGFGYGKKSDFTQSTTLSPGSNKYNLASQVGKGKGRTFACSREASPNKSYIPLQLKQVPGPGQYDDGVKMRGSVVSRTRSPSLPYPYSPGNYFPSKYKSTKYGTIEANISRFPEIRMTPGPGQYELEDKTQVHCGYVDSSFRSTRSRVFDKEARFTNSFWKTVETPGPGRYEPESPTLTS